MAKKDKAPRKGHGVYDVKQAEKLGGEWNKDVAHIEDTKKFPHAYADSVNSNFDTTGKFLEINEKLNDQYLKDVEKKTSAGKAPEQPVKE